MIRKFDLNYQSDRQVKQCNWYLPVTSQFKHLFIQSQVRLCNLLLCCQLLSVGHEKVVYIIQ